MFAELGATVRPVGLPPCREFEDVKKIIALCELYATYGHDLRTAPHLFGENFRVKSVLGL